MLSSLLPASPAKRVLAKPGMENGSFLKERKKKRRKERRKTAETGAGGWLGSAESNHVPNQAHPHQNSSSRGCFTSTDKWEAFSRAVRAVLFNSLKLLLLFSFNMNANTSAFLGGFINCSAHHSEPRNSCQVPTSLSRAHCRVWIPLILSHDGKQVQGRIKYIYIYTRDNSNFGSSLQSLNNRADTCWSHCSLHPA